MATIGKPAVIDIRALDLRAVQGAISQIRERLLALDQAATSLITQVNSSGSATNIATLQIQLAQLAIRVTALENQVGSGDDIVNLVATTTIVVGDPVVATVPSGCSPVDVTDPEAIYAVIGIATQSAAPGQNVPVRRWGGMSLTGVSFTIGRAVYADTVGLTQYPSYSAVAIPLGVATGTTTMWVAPGWPALLALGFDAGYENFLPASVGLVSDAIAFMTSFNALADGIIVKVGENQVASRSIEVEGLLIFNPDGVAGNPLIIDSDDTPVGPGAGATVLTGLAPSVFGGSVLMPGAGNVTISGETPTAV